jgi:hypothetical protein
MAFGGHTAYVEQATARGFWSARTQAGGAESSLGSFNPVDTVDDANF